MADKIVLNTPRFKGEFDLDVVEQPLTNLEWRWVKKISGYMPATISDGWEGADPDLFVAFAVIALARGGKIQKANALAVADELADLPFDGNSITVIGDTSDDEEETDAVPPAEAAPTPPMRSIGGSSSSTSDRLEPLPRVTGVPA